MIKAAAKNIATIAVCFILLLNTTKLRAQKISNWDYYTVSEGLIDNYVECLLEDKNGFLWVGTWSGLSRYNGKEFTTYRSSNLGNSSLPGNWIYCLIQDKKGTIWVGTDEGLAYYNADSDEFVTIETTFGNSIIAMKEDRKGNIWAGGKNQLFQLSSLSKNVIFTKKFNSNNKGFDFDISALLPDKSGNLWIGTFRSGLIKMSPNKNTSVPNFNTQLSHSLKDKITALESSADGSIFVGTANSGLIYFKNGNISNFQLLKHQSKNPNSLFNNTINYIYKDKTNTIWIGNPSGNVNKYIGPQQGFKRLTFHPEANNAGIDLPTTCLLTDRFGNIWLGTHGNGILAKNKQKENFYNHGNSVNSNTGIKISSFVELDNGKILVGSDGNGLHLFDPAEQTFTKVNLGPNFTSSKILNIKKGNKNDIWLSFWSQGVLRIDQTTFKIIQHIEGNTNNKNALFCSNIKGICVDDSSLWIASHGEGVFIFDFKKNVVLNQNKKSALINFSEPKWGNSITKDSQKRIWIGTKDGLYLLKDDRLSYFYHDRKNAQSLISNAVIDVFEDSKNNIWIVTDGGLDLYNTEVQNFTHVGSILGIPDLLKGITEDKKGRLWISSNTGITCVDLLNNKITQLSTSDGLPINTFYQKAAYTTAKGELLFGSLNGFTFFDPDKSSTKKSVPDIVFTDIQINFVSQKPNENSFLKNHIQNTSSISIDYSTNVLTLKYAAIDLCNFKNIKYRYRLKNESNGWISVGSQNFISLSNLNPGKHLLEIIAQNVKGSSSSKIKQLEIIILPPWYKTKMAYFIYFNLGVALLFLVYYLITISLRARNKLIAQRYDHMNKLQLYKSKINFFTSLSHDIRTPLALIIAPIELLREKVKNNADADKILNTMERNAHSLLKLVNEILEFRKLEDGERKIKLTHTNLNPLIEKIAQEFTNQAQLKNIELSVNLNDSSINADATLIEKLISNLFINAFKFTPNNGEIKIKTYNSKRNYIISIYNTGSSISEDLKVKIFDPFYTSKSEKGFGLGLAIVKEITKLHRGRIDVKNLTGGVEFSIILPRK
ncbi:MAG: ATP-binding protein [Bacteroidetes bacterium]|nr:ATP-binding protein [Bacteroidota bacterium]